MRAILLIFLTGLQSMCAIAQDTPWTYALTIKDSDKLTPMGEKGYEILKDIGMPQTEGNYILQATIVGIRSRPCNGDLNAAPKEMCTDFFIQRRIVR